MRKSGRLVTRYFYSASIRSEIHTTLPQLIQVINVLKINKAGAADNTTSKMVITIFSEVLIIKPLTSSSALYACHEVRNTPLDKTLVAS